jgi:hypothetical protein
MVGIFPKCALLVVKHEAMIITNLNKCGARNGGILLHVLFKSGTYPMLRHILLKNGSDGKDLGVRSFPFSRCGCDLSLFFSKRNIHRLKKRVASNTLINISKCFMAIKNVLYMLDVNGYFFVFLLIWVDHIIADDRSWHSIDDANIVVGALVGVMPAPIAICALILIISGESIDKKSLQMGSPLGTRSQSPLLTRMCLILCLHKL